MAPTTIARWTLPLTALLFVNTVLVALASRHVGLIPERAAVVAEASGAIEETLSLDDASAATEPRSVASSEPPDNDLGSPTQVASEASDVNVAEAADWTFGEFALTIDAHSTAVANRDDVASGPTSQPSVERPADAASAPVAIAEDQPPSQFEILIFINPPDAGGVVHFVIDGKVISLDPGAYYCLPVAEERLVQFHRGDEFGDAEHRCQFGVYAFAVGDAGWTLAEVGGSLAARLLKVCRPMAARTEADSD